MVFYQRYSIKIILGDFCWRYWSWNVQLVYGINSGLINIIIVMELNTLTNFTFIKRQSNFIRIHDNSWHRLTHVWEIVLKRQLRSKYKKFKKKWILYGSLKDFFRIDRACFRNVTINWYICNWSRILHWDVFEMYLKTFNFLDFFFISGNLKIIK